ncbi:hypothetical protein [Rhizobium binae]|nr:hypothetical protein [Rhizobium binae]MBX4964737.1 hypothetical protein [Rhizobium binae]
MTSLGRCRGLNHSVPVNSGQLICPGIPPLIIHYFFKNCGRVASIQMRRIFGVVLSTADFMIAMRPVPPRVGKRALTR